MGKTTTWQYGILDLVFSNIAFTGLGDAGGLLPSASAGSLYVSLHTADPGEGGDQSTSEIVYTSYARVAVSRAGGWVRTGNRLSPVTSIVFPMVTGGSSPVALYVGIGTASSGAGKLMYPGRIIAPQTGMQCIINFTPILAPTSVLIEA